MSSNWLSFLGYTRYSTQHKQVLSYPTLNHGNFHIMKICQLKYGHWYFGPLLSPVIFSCIRHTYRYVQLTGLSFCYYCIYVSWISYCIYFNTDYGSSCNPVQWNLVIARTMRSWKLPFNIRFLVIPGKKSKRAGTSKITRRFYHIRPLYNEVPLYSGTSL